MDSIPYLFHSTQSCQSFSNEDDEGCKLLDSFAILVQITLASTALITLFYKRSREKPQRPMIVWYDKLLHWIELHV